MSGGRAAGVVALGAALLGGCGWIVGVTGDVSVVDVSDASSEATAADAREASAEAGGDAGVAAPGFARCGATVCTPAARACCFGDGEATCFAGPSAGCEGALAECDESDDCDGGVCCVARVAQIAGFQSRCAAACGPGEARTCSSAPECGLEGCVAWPCAGITVRTCGAEGALTGCAR